MPAVRPSGAWLPGGARRHLLLARELEGGKPSRPEGRRDAREDAFERLEDPNDRGAAEGVPYLPLASANGGLRLVVGELVLGHRLADQHGEQHGRAAAGAALAGGALKKSGREA